MATRCVNWKHRHRLWRAPGRGDDHAISGRLDIHVVGGTGGSAIGAIRQVVTILYDTGGNRDLERRAAEDNRANCATTTVCAGKVCGRHTLTPAHRPVRGRQGRWYQTGSPLMIHSDHPAIADGAAYHLDNAAGGAGLPVGIAMRDPGSHAVATCQGRRRRRLARCRHGRREPAGDAISTRQRGVRGSTRRERFQLPALARPGGPGTRRPARSHLRVCQSPGSAAGDQPHPLVTDRLKDGAARRATAEPEHLPATTRREPTSQSKTRLSRLHADPPTESSFKSFRPRSWPGPRRQSSEAPAPAATATHAAGASLTCFHAGRGRWR